MSGQKRLALSDTALVETLATVFGYGLKRVGELGMGHDVGRFRIAL